MAEVKHGGSWNSNLDFSEEIVNAKPLFKKFEFNAWEQLDRRNLRVSMYGYEEKGTGFN